MDGNHVSSLLEAVIDEKSLTRERGLAALKKGIDEQCLIQDEAALAKAEATVISYLHDNTRWESRYGGIKAAILFVNALDRTSFRDACITRLGDLIVEPEYRVRVACAELLHVLCAKNPDTYQLFRDALVENIRASFVRAEKEPDHQVAEQDPSVFSQVEEPVSPQPPGVPPNRVATHWERPKGQHDTEGWQCLETSMKCLEGAMKGCGRAFTPHLTDYLMDLLLASTAHINRFVREIGYLALAVVCEVCDMDVFLSRLAPNLTPVLAKGLADNWSMVRFAASTASRAFMIKAGDRKQDFYRQLLPPMCLNRHYLAEGVRTYSQETWKMVVGPKGGARLLLTVLDDVVEVYVAATNAPNHAVREAACYCIAELATKVSPRGPECFTPQRVEKLLSALMDCLEDASWPVRDAACSGTADFVQALPDAVLASGRVLELAESWADGLGDNIRYLRANAAHALACGFKTFPMLRPSMLHLLTSLLGSAKEQPALSKTFTQYTPSGPFSVPQRLPLPEAATKDFDPEHTDQPMYSCGSLAPKFFSAASKAATFGHGPLSKKLVAPVFFKMNKPEVAAEAPETRGRVVKDTPGGCMRCVVDRRRQPWEVSEGCIYLLREVAEVCCQKEGPLPQPDEAREAANQVVGMIPTLLEVFKLDHFRHHTYLKETICNQLPLLFSALTSLPSLRTAAFLKTQLSLCVSVMKDGLLASRITLAQQTRLAEEQGRRGPKDQTARTVEFAIVDCLLALKKMVTEPSYKDAVPDVPSWLASNELTRPLLPVLGQQLAIAS